MTTIQEVNKAAIKFPIFEDIKVSTKTFIAMTNLDINIVKFYESIPITDYEIVPKKRGRKKKIVLVDPNKNIPPGSIITLDYEGKVRGVDLKKKKRSKGKNRGNFFRNSVTVVMTMPENKRINFKISKNGRIQMTGCKDDSHAEKCIDYVWNYIKDSKDIYTMNGPHLRVMFIPAMRNIDFSIGFLINRERLDKYFNEKTDYHSLLETSFGYTGVNIKIPVTANMNTIKIKQREFKDDKWAESIVSYENYLDQLPEKEKEKKIKKERFNTFLVFHSGKIILSAMCEEIMKPAYHEFINIIRDCYDLIEERLENKKE